MSYRWMCMLLLLSGCVSNRRVDEDVVALTEVGALEIGLETNVYPSGLVGSLYMYMYLLDYDDEYDCPLFEELTATVGGREADEVTPGGYYLDFSEFAPLTPERVCWPIELEWSEDLAGAPTEETVDLVLEDASGARTFSVPNPWLVPTLTLVSPEGGEGGPGDVLRWSYAPATDDIWLSTAWFYQEGSNVFDGEVSFGTGEVAVTVPSDITSDAEEVTLRVIADAGEVETAGGDLVTMNREVEDDFTVAIHATP